ncbi:MAG: hypothetical protein Q8882_03050 [Bacillota bacterium]|nr:hypothetical protein [Bacillota bacterium]
MKRHILYTLASDKEALAASAHLVRTLGRRTELPLWLKESEDGSEEDLLYFDSDKKISIDELLKNMQTGCLSYIYESCNNMRTVLLAEYVGRMNAGPEKIYIERLPHCYHTVIREAKKKENVKVVGLYRKDFKSAYIEWSQIYDFLAAHMKKDHFKIMEPLELLKIKDLADVVIADLFLKDFVEIFLNHKYGSSSGKTVYACGDKKQVFIPHSVCREKMANKYFLKPLDICLCIKEWLTGLGYLSAAQRLTDAAIEAMDHEDDNDCIGYLNAVSEILDRPIRRRIKDENCVK